MKKIFFFACMLVLMTTCLSWAQSAPTLTVYAPTNNYWSSSTSVSFGYEVGDVDNNLTSVKLYVALIGVNPFTNPIAGFPVDLPFSPSGGSFQKSVTIPKGAYNWRIEAKDATGRYMDSPLWYLNVQTNRAPTVTINSLTVNGTSITVTWSGSDPDGDALQYRTRIDAGSWSAKSSSTSVTINSIPSGARTFYVEVSDASLSNTASRDFTIATTNRAPTVNLTSPVDGYSTTSKRPPLSFSASDPDGDAIDCYIYISNTCSPPDACPLAGYPYYVGTIYGSGTLTFTPNTDLIPSLYSWEVKGTDRTLNGWSAVRTFTVTSANREPILSPSAPGNGSTTTNKRPTFTVNVNDADGNRVDCYLNLSNVCSPPRSCNIAGFPVYMGYVNGSGSLSYTPVSDLSPGLYSWEVRGYDGTTDGWSIVWTFTVNTLNTAPYFSNVSPADNFRTTNTEVQFGYGVGDAECNLSIVQLFVANGTNDPFTTPMPGYPKVVPGTGCGNTQLITQTFSVGQYRWALKATDQLGLLSTVGPRTLYVEAVNQPPTVTLYSPANNAHISAGALTALRYGINDPENGQMSVLLYLTNSCSSPRSCPMPGFPVSVTLPNGIYDYLLTMSIPSGPYSWEIKVTDNAGNTVWSPTWTFTIDPVNHPPTVAINLLTVDGQSVDICWSGSDPDPGQGISYRFKLDNEPWSVWSSQICVRYNNLADGTHTFYVEVKDTPGATGADQKQFTISNPGPTLSVENVSAYESDKVTLAVTASDNSGIAEYAFDLDGDGTYEKTYTSLPIVVQFDDVGYVTASCKVIAIDRQSAISSFTIDIYDTDDENPSTGETIVNVGKVQRYGWSFLEVLDKLPSEHHAKLEEKLLNTDFSFNNPNWRSYRNDKFPGSKILDIGDWTIGGFRTQYQLKYYDFSEADPLKYDTKVKSFQMDAYIKDMSTNVDYHLHDGHVFKAKHEPGGTSKVLLERTDLRNYRDGEIIFPKVGKIDKSGEKFIIITDLAAKDPEMWSEGQYKTIWQKLFDSQDETERVFNMKGIKLEIPDLKDWGSSTVDGAVANAKTILQKNNRVIIADAAGAFKGSKTIKYLAKGGRVLVVASYAISILDIGYSAALQDWDGAICKASGEAAATFTGILGAKTCVAGCGAIVELPPVAVACGLVCAGVTIYASYESYTQTKEFCDTHIHIVLPNGEEGDIDPSVYELVDQELQNLGFGTKAQVNFTTTGSQTVALSALGRGLLHIYEAGVELLPDEKRIYLIQYTGTDGKQQEIMTILNPKNDQLLVKIDTTGQIPTTLFTLTMSAQTYDTLALNVPFSNVQSTGYSYNVHVNQAPYATFAYRVSGVPTVITDTVTIVQNTTLIVYPQLSYDPDGDALLDFSMDIMGDNTWEISQLTNFTQGLDLKFDALGVYPVVLRVRDQYQLSGFDTIYVKVDVADGVGDEPTLPKTFSLAQNYPNPFNPTTTIAFSLAHRCDVQLQVYNLLGQEVISWSLSDVPAGEHQLTWEATNRSGKPVSSGVYFYRLQAADFSETKKMLLLR